MSIIIFLSIIILLVGLYLYSRCAYSVYSEGFTNTGKRCPDILIQKGSRFYLHNSKLATVPGVNPVEFANLEDYVEFLDWQRSQGIRCPVLYLQQTYDAQGNPVYKVRPSVTEPQGGLPPSVSTQPTINSTTQQITPPQYDPALTDDYLHKDNTLLVDATHNDPPYNRNSYPSFDQSAYYNGTNTPLDEMDKEKEKPGTISPDPMDTNWGGADYTESLVQKGYYADNEIAIAIN
jgi:hypothetical protein